MKFKTLLLLILVVVVPTALLSWGGFQFARQQSDQMEDRLRSLMTVQLSELDSRIRRYFSVQEAALQKITSKSYADIDSIRETAESDGLVDNLFIIAANNILVYPNPISPLNRRELDFYSKIKAIVDDREIQNQILKVTSENRKTTDPMGNASRENEMGFLAGETLQTQVETQQNQTGSSISQSEDSQRPVYNPLSQLAQAESQSVDSSNLQNSEKEKLDRGFEVCEGWFVWYWGKGVNLIFWQQQAAGNMVCVALERSRWMADLVAELPETTVVNEQQTAHTDRSTRIVNASGEVLYQWGNPNSQKMVLAAEIPVSFPLTSWKLQMQVNPDELRSQSLVGLNIVLGIIAFTLALISVAWIFFREYKKDLQEAGKRVSFVNQVSHELRTPLTNIRMYAELLNREISELEGIDVATAKKRIEVVESESNRLSRLITNVLSFAGSQKKKLEIRATSGVVDDCIENVLSSFSPQLERLGIELRTDLQAREPVRFDADALGQMLGNVISNTEKYAADGDFVTVKSRQEPGFTVITINDDGKGIPPKYSEKIFEPFWRLSDQLQHASGTGIGLSISRELARIHGGDLTLEGSSHGACFVIRIKTEGGK